MGSNGGGRFTDILITSYEEWGVYTCVIQIGSERFVSNQLEITHFPGIFSCSYFHDGVYKGGSRHKLATR